MKKKTETIDARDGDVFSGLWFKDARERKLRIQLAIRTNNLLRERRLTRAKAAVLFCVTWLHVSELRHYRLKRFSSELLMHFIRRIQL